MLQGEENGTSAQMEADQIIDHAETSPRFNSTEKHTAFYFVKYHRYEDPEITCKIEEACGEIQKKTEDIKYYKEELKEYEKEENKANWRIYSGKDSHLWNTRSIDSKRKCLFDLQNALNKKSTDYRVAMQSLEVKELTNQISDFRHRLQKEKLTLKEQKQLIKQMKELKVERDEIVTVESLNSKKKRKEVIKQCEHFKCQKIPTNKWAQAITDEIDGLKARQNDCYNENDGVRKSAKRIADTKDIAALDELSNNEFEKFFSRWNDDEAVRNDYARRILWSLDSRGLSKDGRIWNPDESISTAQEYSIPWPRAVCK
ncbi:proton pump-interactor [Rhynchospora pubera]|uniref:Proton pump-interactor n=1 Tax=Rhynchospora pubera TaxID=906938 RepID=A0AAV8DRV1_9POAL|nr:proton pump-interactor [Rhynchospora pubera]